MKTYINIGELSRRIEDFYTITNIRMTVFGSDAKEITSYPPVKCPFCAYMRKYDAFDRKCYLCDQRHMEEAAHSSAPLLYSCHAGIYEMIAPLSSDGVLVGFLFFSHILNYPSHSAAWKAIAPTLKAYPNVDLAFCHNAIDAMPLFKANYLKAASSLLQAAAAYFCGSRIAYLKKEGYFDRIDAYINEHLSENLTVVSLAKQFHLSRSTMYEISKTLYPDSIAKHIRRLRVAKAEKRLEEDPTISVADVAEETGFHDYSYFIAVFRHFTGMTPRKYAKKTQKE